MKDQPNLVYMLSQLAESLSAQLNERLTRYQLDIRLWSILMRLWQSDGITQVELSKRCQIPTYTMTRALDQLQKLNLIERCVEPDNRRAFLVYLTKEAKALELDMMHECHVVESKYFKDLNDDDHLQLIHLLQRLRKF